MASARAPGNGPTVTTVPVFRSIWASMVPITSTVPGPCCVCGWYRTYTAFLSSAMTLALPPLPTAATWKVRAIQGVMLGDPDGDADGATVGEAVAGVAGGDALGDCSAVGTPQPAHARR